MIDGLKLTVTGVDLRTLLEQRIDDHLRRAEHWKRELTKTAADQSEDDPVLPEHICENEAERHEWRADVLGFIRERIDTGEIYQLGEADLLFGELLPEPPGWLEQAEYEQRTSIGFNLERLVRTIGELTPAAYALAHARDREEGQEW